MTKTDKSGSPPVLSMEAMVAQGWDAALSLPFPDNSNSMLLREARRQVLNYLDWITSDNGINHEGPDWAVDEIRRASDRLIEICEAMPAVLDVESEADTEARYQKERPGAGERSRHREELRKAPPKGHDA